MIKTGRYEERGMEDWSKELSIRIMHFYQLYLELTNFSYNVNL